MAPRAAIQNQKNSTLKIFQPAEIVPNWTPIRNKNQESNFKPLPLSFRCAPREHSRSSSLYVLYTYDLPTSRETKLGTFSGDTAILANQEDLMIASFNLQSTYTSSKNG